MTSLLITKSTEIDSNSVLEQNKFSKILEQYTKDVVYDKIYDPNNIPKLPNSYNYSYRQNPELSFIPTQPGDKFIFKIRNKHFLNGILIRASTIGSTNVGSTNEGLRLWRKYSIVQDGKTIWTCTPSYLSSRIDNEPFSIENYLNDIIDIQTDPIDPTINYYLAPLFAPCFDKDNNYLLLQNNKNLELHLEWADCFDHETDDDIVFFDTTGFNVQIEIFCTAYEDSFEDTYQFKNYDKDLVNKYWYNVRSFSNQIPTSADNNLLPPFNRPGIYESSTTSATLHLDQFFYSLKSIYCIVYDSLGNEKPIISMIIKKGDQVIGYIDNFSKNLLTYYSKDRYIPGLTTNSNGSVYTFGLKDKIGFTGLLCLNPDQYSITINYTEDVSTDLVWYCDVEYIQTLVSHKDGSLQLGPYY